MSTGAVPKMRVRGRVAARSMLEALGAQVTFLVANNGADEVGRVAVVALAVVLAFCAARKFAHDETRRKLQQGADPGLTLRVLALFNPYCEAHAHGVNAASEPSAAGADDQSPERTEWRRSAAARSTPSSSGGRPAETFSQRRARRASISRPKSWAPGATGSIKGCGVLFVDKEVLERTTTGAPFLVWGLYARAEIGIALSFACIAALNLTPPLEHSIESVLFGLVGYRILSPASAAVASLLESGGDCESGECKPGIERGLADEVRQEVGVTHTALDLISFVLRGSMWLFGLWTFLSWLGYPMNTLVSAFGIGGLSIGLASQAVLKDLVGTTILVFDEWFDVGSKITVKGLQGRVEEFGMRSTKIRLIKDGEILFVPNSTLASEIVINGDDIPKRRNQIDMWIDGSTEYIKMVALLDGLTDELEEYDGIVDAQAHFMDACPVKGMRLEVVYQFTPGDEILLWKQSRSYAMMRLALRMQRVGVRPGCARALVAVDGGGGGGSRPLSAARSVSPDARASIV